jgi:hypothetical protein
MPEYDHANLTISVEDLMYLRDMLDNERVGHLNRAADFVLYADRATDDETRQKYQALAVKCATEAERCSSIRALLQRKLSRTEGN